MLETQSLGSMHWSLVFILLATNVLKKKSEIIHRIRLQPMNRDVGFYSSSTASILIHSPATNNHLNRKKPLRCKFLKQCRQEMENRPHRKDGNGSKQWIRKFYSRCTKKAALLFRCDYDNHCFQRSPLFSARDVWRWLEINAKCLKIAKRLLLKNFVSQLRLAQKKAPIRSIQKPAGDKIAHSNSGWHAVDMLWLVQRKFRTCAGLKVSTYKEIVAFHGPNQSVFQFILSQMSIFSSSRE